MASRTKVLIVTGIAIGAALVVSLHGCSLSELRLKAGPEQATALQQETQRLHELLDLVVRDHRAREAVAGE